MARKGLLDTNLFDSVFYIIIGPPISLPFAFANGDVFAIGSSDLVVVAYLALAGILGLCTARSFAYYSINLITPARATQLNSAQLIFASLLV